ncbi:DNA-binding protein [Kribbella sp. NPDC048928]|uniref:DNA-binding protein n=1 Tax=Kribbella sp. NPDC048928 TaxID=3364111 RepID=UPI003723ED73
MDQTAHNLQQQVELYGEPLGVTVRRVAPLLGLTQGALAHVIGLSAPMLSQLMSAQRVKIGNPAVVSRLRAVSELAELAATDEIGRENIPEALDAIRETSGAYPTTITQQLRPTARPPLPATGSATAFAGPPGLDRPAGQTWTAAPPDPAVAAPPSARAVVREIQELFREVAAADEIQRAAAAAAAESPAVAELLLAYGTGRTADALAHYEQHHG